MPYSKMGLDLGRHDSELTPVANKNAMLREHFERRRELVHEWIPTVVPVIVAMS